jgi:hypothetical protein
MRVPRQRLASQFGVLRGSLYMSKKMHDEDNALGLWCTHNVRAPGARRVVWRAYGDGHLFDKDAEVHLDIVREAVRRSAAEVYAMYCGIDIPEYERAEAVIPIPLAPGATPSLAGDELHAPSTIPPNKANHWPMYRVRGQTVEVRVGDGAAESYVAAPQFDEIELLSDRVRS